MKLVLHELLPVILPLLIAFVTVVGVKAVLGVTFGGMFLALGGFVLPYKSPERDKGSARDESSANIEAGPVKVRWQGLASTGLLVAGVLMLILAIIVYLDSHVIL